MPKFFTSPALISDGSVKIVGEDVAHISKVLRMSPGDKITVCDGEGNDYDAVIEQIGKTEVTAKITGSYVCEAEPSVRITLYQSLPKQGKMEYIIQKCTELGVARIVPVYTKRCIVKPSDKTERWNKVALSAAKQCGRGIVPKVMPVLTFDQAVLQMSKSECALMPYECEEKTRLKDIICGKTFRDVSLFIGPEGGFELSEVEKAIGLGIKPVTLGKRILRTETAAAAVLPIIMYENDEI